MEARYYVGFGAVGLIILSGVLFYFAFNFGELDNSSILLGDNVGNFSFEGDVLKLAVIEGNSSEDGFVVLSYNGSRIFKEVKVEDSLVEVNLTELGIFDYSLIEKIDFYIGDEALVREMVFEDLNNSGIKFENLSNSTVAGGGSSGGGGGNNPPSGNNPEIVPENLLMNLSQFGITWVFDKPLSTNGAPGTYQYGTFVNGDYWVKTDNVSGVVNVVRITPESVNESGRIKHGSMINPSPLDYRTQGYDNGMDVTSYNHSLNVAFEVSSNNPLKINSDSSLVSSISIENPKNRPQLKTAAILTILNTVPEKDSFRPPYSGIDKSIKFTKKNLDYSKLKNLPLPLNVPILHKDVLDDLTDHDETVERMFERPWIDDYSYHFGRNVHPQENMEDYGSQMAVEVGLAALMLNLNYTNEEKETLLIRFVQLGLDNYGIIQNAKNDIFEADGGHTRGRKLPILFASLVLDDSDMQEMFEKTGDYLYSESYGPGSPPEDLIHFSEDDQTFYVSEDDVYDPPYAIYNLYEKNLFNEGSVDVIRNSNQVKGHGTNWNTYILNNKTYFAVVNGLASSLGYGGYDYKIVDLNEAEQIITLNQSFKGNSANNVGYSVCEYIQFGHGHVGNHRDYLEYTSLHLGMPEAGYDHASSPISSGLDWDANYREGIYSGGEVLSVLIMGAKELWNHDSWFDYHDRFVDVQKELGLYTSDYSQDIYLYGGDGSGFNKEMWETYRNDYGCTYKEMNTISHTRIYDCGSDIVDCKDVNVCQDYPNKRSFDYDPCDLGC